MTILTFLNHNAAEILGMLAALGLIAFAVDYTRHANWRENDQGRAVMYLILTLAATVILLVIHGLAPTYPFRWIVEVVVYSPLVVSAFYMRHTLRKSFGLQTRWLFRVPKKDVTAEEALEEDTRP